MKKILALLMVAVMCFSLAACGGDKETSNKNDKEIDIKKVDVVGTWINTASTSHGMKMVIEEDGTGSCTLGEQVAELVWERIDDDTLTINTDSNELLFEMGVSNGVVELLWQGTFSHYTMVSEQDYNNMIEAVEITADNWQNYLEIKPYAKPSTDDFNEITGLQIGCSLVLKDEYVDKLVASDGAIGYTISGQYKCHIEYNSATKELTLGAPFTEAEMEAMGMSNSDQVITDTGKLGFYREYGFEIFRDASYSGSCEVNGDIVSAVVSYYENIEITKIQGNLYFEK